jgi:hypothetical protein
METDIRSIQLSEHDKILHAVSVERKWWGSSPRYSTEESAIEAYKKGELVEVEIPNIFFTSPSDLRNNLSLRLAKPELVNFMQEIFTKTSQKGVDPNKYIFCVSSLLRTDNDQSNVAGGIHWYRAAEPGTSSHAYGVAFDVSVRSHYIRNDEGIQSVRTWDSTNESYEPSIFSTLAEVLDESMERGLCNFVRENYIDDVTGESQLTCFHVCLAPKN